jgi:hypothetical protein
MGRRAAGVPASSSAKRARALADAALDATRAGARTKPRKTAAPAPPGRRPLGVSAPAREPVLDVRLPLRHVHLQVEIGCVHRAVVRSAGAPVGDQRGRSLLPRRSDQAQRTIEQRGACVEPRGRHGGRWRRCRFHGRLGGGGARGRRVGRSGVDHGLRPGRRHHVRIAHPRGDQVDEPHQHGEDDEKDQLAAHLKALRWERRSAPRGFPTRMGGRSDHERRWSPSGWVSDLTWRTGGHGQHGQSSKL